MKNAPPHDSEVNHRHRKSDDVSLRKLLRFEIAKNRRKSFSTVIIVGQTQPDMIIGAWPNFRSTWSCVLYGTKTNYICTCYLVCIHLPVLSTNSGAGVGRNGGQSLIVQGLPDAAPRTPLISMHLYSTQKEMHAWSSSTTMPSPCRIPSNTSSTTTTKGDSAAKLH